MAVSEDLTQLCLRLFEVEAVKFGSFLLKNGFYSPIYIDLRVITTYPEILEKVAFHIWEVVKSNNLQFDNLCGVPYTALPIATVVSIKNGVPMLVRRREAKDYGTKKMIEGHFKENQHCLVIEDVVTSGTSIMETVQLLNSVGLQVKDAIVFLDRDQGGIPNLAKEGVALKAVLTIHQIVEVLHSHNKIDAGVVQKVNEFLVAFGSTDLTPTLKPLVNNEQNGVSDKQLPTLSYELRADLCKHPVARRLFQVMAEKKTNLCVAADVTSSQELLKVAEAVGPHICILKTHIDILTDFTSSVVDKLTQLAIQHNFLLFEDRKFSDIGNTVGLQYAQGVHRVVDWADLVTAHALPGSGVLSGLQQAVKGKSRGCLLVAEMSSAGSLTDNKYAQAAVGMSKAFPDFVVGFISQSRIGSDPQLLHMTPGVQLNPSSGDGLGQHYNSPQEVVTKRGTDVIIVGRGIIQASDVSLAARLHQEAGFQAYLQTLTV